MMEVVRGRVANDPPAAIVDPPTDLARVPVTERRSGPRPANGSLEPAELPSVLTT